MLTKKGSKKSSRAQNLDKLKLQVKEILHLKRTKFLELEVKLQFSSINRKLTAHIEENIIMQEGIQTFNFIVEAL